MKSATDRSVWRYDGRRFPPTNSIRMTVGCYRRESGCGGKAEVEELVGRDGIVGLLD